MADLPYVYWVGYCLPEQKVDNAIYEAMEKFPVELEVLPVMINFFAKEQEQDLVQEILEQIETELRDNSIILGQYDSDLAAYPAVLPTKMIQWLINKDYVLYLELETPTFAAHDFSMPVIGVDYIRPGSVGINYTGASTIVGIMDTGFMLGDESPIMHVDLNKNGCGRNFTTNSAGVWNDEQGHGTHVLATLCGTGSGDARYRGVAMGVGTNSWTRIRAAKIMKKNGEELKSWMRQAVRYMSKSSSCDSGRPQVVNISGGSKCTNAKGTGSLARKLDKKVWKQRQAYIVSAGNNGPDESTIKNPSSAKNALTVGNVLDFGYETIGDIAEHSSRGPTGDDRMKPNIVASGVLIKSALAGTTNDYEFGGGTSMATPHITGLAATLLEHYPVFQDQPCLLRAHLMATVILHNNYTAPNTNTLGGRNTYGLGRASSYISHWDRPNANGWSVFGATRCITNDSWGYYDINVPQDADRLVVVMTWDEPPASAGDSHAVKFDLDLWIDHNPDALTGNIAFLGEWSSNCRHDNVEYVIIDDPPPPPGLYRLKIGNWNAPGYGVPAAVVATVIRGDPTPDLDLSVTANTLNPPVGSIVEIETTVTNPDYIASGVYIEFMPDHTDLTHAILTDLTYMGVRTTREDGVEMDFPSSSTSLSLGNIIEGDSRSATWLFQVNNTSFDIIYFQIWSENGGTETGSITITPAS